MTGLVGNTDPSGQVGGRVAERLAARGIHQRLIVCDDVQASRLPPSQAAAASGYGDYESMKEAATGVETLFLVPIREHPERARLHMTAVDAAVAGGIKRIVYSSFLGAGPEAPFTLARDHYATEEHIRSTGVAFHLPAR